MSTNYSKEPFVPSSERPPYIEELRAEIRGVPYRPAKRKKSSGPCRPSPEDCHRMFNVEKGNRWLELARREPEAKMLFGELWHQGELCMLFADTNIGKSVLAVQIGESIARGQSIAPFACEAPHSRVLYIDFELTQAQFGQRYSNGGEDHEFSDNFYRAQYNFIPDPPPNVDENELLIAAIEYKIQRIKATVLIIDNITCLRGGTENSVVALSLMKSLKALKTDHKLSILVLAHTPKRRNPTQPISADDLHGSKLLINFADSAFAIGKSTLRGPQCDTNSDLCYLKQIKQRNTRQRYGADNVCLCRIQKPGAFLHFTFEGFSAEHLHLLTRTAAYRQQIAKKIAELSVKGLGQRAISDQLGIPLTTVNRLLRCADVQMCGCADEKGSGDTLMTNDVMTNDQNGCADMQMCGCADEEGCANDEGCVPHERDAMRGCADEVSTVDGKFTEMQMPENRAAESMCTNPLPREGMVQRTATEEGLTGYAHLPPAPIVEIQRAAPTGSPKPARGLKISTIDKLLTPELLDQILGTTKRQDFIRGKGSDCFDHPDTLMDTAAKDDDP